jgi:hypothetical protein
VVLDDYKASKLAKAEGLKIVGGVTVFRQLLVHNVYIDRRPLDGRLGAWDLARFEPYGRFLGCAGCAGAKARCVS